MKCHLSSPLLKRRSTPRTLWKRGSRTRTPLSRSYHAPRRSESPPARPIRFRTRNWRNSNTIPISINQSPSRNKIGLSSIFRIKTRLSGRSFKLSWRRMNRSVCIRRTPSLQIKSRRLLTSSKSVPLLPHPPSSPTNLSEGMTKGVL